MIDDKGLNNRYLDFNKIKEYAKLTSHRGQIILTHGDKDGLNVGSMVGTIGLRVGDMVLNSIIMGTMTEGKG